MANYEIEATAGTTINSQEARALIEAACAKAHSEGTNPADELDSVVASVLVGDFGWHRAPEDLCLVNTEAEEDFIASADSRETSPELMRAIWKVALGVESEAVRIWEAPTNAEIVAIQEIVTNNGLGRMTGEGRDAEDYCWGAAGREWAQS